ncbi:MAG: valine--tRNA ligase, partial [Lactobacillales bacterium]|nr:valine--tRNA ligase [Lactobacillales bacterium]
IFRHIGHSYDWNLKYTTISPKAIAVSQKSFLDLIQKGLAKSIEAPTIWDVTFQSAVAQAEIEDRETEGFFHDIEFKIDGEENTSFTIATTRPEFLPACIAVVAHPDDERYQKYFGRNAIVPIFDIPVPIIASEHADKEIGTGILMVCTFGDAADVAWWKQSGLPIKQIIGLDGRILPHTYGNAPFVSLNAAKADGYYQQLVGLKVKDAREKVVSFLRAENVLKGEPKKISHPVKFYEKGSQPLEFVTSRQWFVDLLNMKETLIKAGREIKWVPGHMHTRYETWVEGLNQDWCISRQRFFGVPFPVWFKIGANGITDYNAPIFAEIDQLPVDPMIAVPKGYTEEMRGKPNGFIGEKDIMDTWATSSLTPQIAMAFAPEGNHLSLPFDIRPQAHDIIRTWAFYTIMKAQAHEKTIPWKQAYISGFILDPDRKKMSKSKGNVITPAHLLEKYSSDAVRYWAGRAKLGIDTAYEEQIMEQGKKVAMKLFNASRFVFQMVEQAKTDTSKDPLTNITHPLDKAWMSKLSETVKTAQKAFENVDYSYALETAEHCFWDFCDNYLEIVKGRAYGDNPLSAVSSLRVTIDMFLKLFAPFMPFITEEIYQSKPWTPAKVSVHVELFPTPETYQCAAGEICVYERAVSLVEMVRKIKAEQKRSLRTPVDELKVSGNDKAIADLQDAKDDIENVLNIKNGNFVFEKTPDELKIQSCILGADEPKK